MARERHEAARRKIEANAKRKAAEVEAKAERDRQISLAQEVRPQEQPRRQRRPRTSDNKSGYLPHNKPSVRTELVAEVARRHEYNSILRI